ncbi:hypothetical protein F4819DRAFT_479985 [Hypoxylon fuscum]|nr:hypothetical protein F4819DRAFT_479985 [Hypoxylon fuscum]
MITVLDGKERIDIDEILERQGSSTYCHSQEGIASLIVELRGDGSRSNEPLVWIEKMLRWPHEDRPNAIQLRDMILQSGETYCGICCRHESIFEDDLPHGVSLNQSTLSNDSSGLPGQVTGPAFAKVLVPHTDAPPSWREVKVTEASSSTKNWISPDIAIEFNLNLCDGVITESTWNGARLKSTKHITATWTIENASWTLHEDFLVATEVTPFEILVTKASFDTLRESITTE